MWNTLSWGKGLGFQKKVGDLVDKEKIEKTFVLENTEAVENGLVFMSICLMLKCRSF